jgi:hypothetical protein
MFVPVVRRAESTTGDRQADFGTATHRLIAQRKFGQEQRRRRRDARCLQKLAPSMNRL